MINRLISAEFATSIKRMPPNSIVDVKVNHQSAERTLQWRLTDAGRQMMAPQSAPSNVAVNPKSEVVRVRTDSAPFFYRAGLRRGDQTVMLNALPISDATVLRTALANTPVGSQIHAIILRDGTIAKHDLECPTVNSQSWRASNCAYDRLRAP